MDEIEKLYNVLVDQGLFDKTLDEFKVKFEESAYVDRVYDAVVDQGLFDKTKEDFTEKYSAKKKIQENNTVFNTKDGLSGPPTAIDPNSEVFKNESDSIDATFEIYKNTQLELQELDKKENKSLEEETQLQDLIIKNDSLRQDILDRGKKLSEDRFGQTTSEPVAVETETETGVKIPKSDLGKILKSNTLSTVGSIADIPNYLGSLALAGAAAVNSDFKKVLNQMTPEQQRDYAAMFGPKFVGMSSTQSGFSASPLSRPKETAAMMEAADELRAATEQYDTNIVQDIFSPRVITGVSRLINEVVGAAPQVALAFMPGGFGLLGGGAAARKTKKLQDDGYELNVGTMINSTATGLAEGIFEMVTRGLAKRGFDSFKKIYRTKGKDATLIELKDVVNEFRRGFRLEGMSEVATEGTEDILDALILGERDSFENAFLRYIDTYLIGGFVGAPLASFGPGMQKLIQNKAKKDLDKTINDSQYSDLTDSFNKEKGNVTINIDQLPIVESAYATQFLDATVNGQLKRNQISQAQADQIKLNFKNTKDILDKIPTEKLTPEQQQKSADLLLRRLELLNYVSQKVPSLVPNEIQELQDIKKELTDIGIESIPVTNTEQATEQNQVDDESVVLDTPRINVAPLFATSINTVQDAIDLRQQPEYKQQIQTINDVLGSYEVQGVIDEAIGGYKNDDGTEIVEISNVVNLGGNVTRDQADQIASILGALAPETQESTIAADYVGETDATRNAEEYLLTVNDIPNTLEALKAAGITDFTLNQANNSLSLLDLDSGTNAEFGKKLDALIKQLNEKQIKYEANDKRAVNSRYIGQQTRLDILQSLQGRSIQQQLEGTGIYQKVEQALDRLGETPTETIVEETAEASPEQVQDLIETINDPAAGIQETITIGRDKGFSDIEIQKVLQGRGFRVRDIKPLLEVKVNTPAAFRNIEGGINVGQTIFDSVQNELDVFVKAADRTKGQIREKASELLKADTTFQTLSDIDQQQLQLGLDKSIGTRANTVIQNEINKIKKEVVQYKKGIKDLNQAQNRVNRFIKNSLPNDADITGFVSSINKVKTKDDLPAVAEKVIQQIEQQREKEKLGIIKKIKTLANNKAKLKKSDSNKIKGGDISAAGKMFFQAIDEMMKAITSKNPIDNFIDITATLTDQAAIDNALELQETNPDELKTSQKRLLNRFYAYNLVGDIFSQPLEAVQDIYNQLIDERSRGIAELNAKRELEQNFFTIVSKQFKDQASIDYEWLYDSDGNHYDSEQLEINQTNILDLNEANGLNGRIKNFLSQFDFASNGGIRFLSSVRGNLATMGTLSKVLDRYGDSANRDGAGEGFFYRNFYEETNVADENKFRGLYIQRDKLNNIAASIGGIESYQDITKLIGYNDNTLNIKGKNVTKTNDNLARIYALSKNEFQRKRLKNQGYTDKVLNKIEDILGGQVIEFIDKTVEYLSTDYYEGVNEVYVKFNNIDIPQINNYFPTKTLTSKAVDLKLITGPDGPAFQSIFAEMSPSAFRVRDEYNQDAKVDLRRGLNFTSTLDSHIQEMEKYKAYAPQVYRLKNIFKIPGMNELLEQVGMAKLYKTMVNNTINPDYGPAGTLPGLDVLAGKFVGYALAFKAVQIPKQATSFITALENYRYLDKKGDRTRSESLIDYAGFVADVGKMIPNLFGELQEMQDVSASFRDRYNKGLEGDLYGLESGGKLALQKTKEGQKRKNKFIKYGGRPTVFGDVLGVSGYKAVYNRNIKNKMPKEEALKAFNDYNSTQQSRRDTDKTMLQMTKNSIVKTITMFLSQIYLMQNKTMTSMFSIIRSLKDKKRPRAKDLRAFSLNFVANNMFFTGVANFPKLLGDDDDRYEFVRRVLFSPLNLVWGIPILGAGFEALQGYLAGDSYKKITTVTNPYLEIAETTGKAIQKLQKEGPDLENLLKLIKPLFEIRIGARVDPLIGLYNYFKDLKLDEGEVYDFIGSTKYYRPEEKPPVTPVKQTSGSFKLDKKTEQSFDEIDEAMKTMQKPIDDLFKDIDDAIFK